MGISYTIHDRGFAPNVGRSHLVDASFDTSYTAGGEPLAPSDARLDRLDAVEVLSDVSPGGYVVGYDLTAETLKVFEGPDLRGPLVEVAGGTDLSAEEVRLRVTGRS